MAVDGQRAKAARKQLGHAIRTRRHAEGMTMAELGARAGLSLSTITSIELGRRGPSIDALLLLADALGCSARSLLTGLPAWDEPAQD